MNDLLDTRVWLFVLGGAMAVLALVVRWRERVYATSGQDTAPSQIDGIVMDVRFNFARFPEGDCVAMRYADADGVVTERIVAVRRAGNAYVRGWCFLRGDERTFRADRILALLDPQTGRPIASMREARRKSPVLRAKMTKLLNDRDAAA